jgi:hypothetical protein
MGGHLEAAMLGGLASLSAVSWHRTLVLAFVSTGLIAIPALARDDGQWSNQPPEIRQWFESVMQPNNRASCCGEADAFDVQLDGEEQNGDIRAIILNGRGLYPDGTLVLVPHTKLQPKYGNPLDKVILFIGAGGRPICLIPKVGM